MNTRTNQVWAIYKQCSRGYLGRARREWYLAWALFVFCLCTCIEKKWKLKYKM